MKVVFAGFAAVLAVGCATPQPIVDTASRVSLMSDAMDRSITNYVDSLNNVRRADERRLQELRSDTQRHKVPIQEKLQILAVAQDDRTARSMNDLAIAPVADPSGLDAGLTAPPAQVEFDDSSLKTVTAKARDIARKATTADQFKVLLDFAMTVNADLQKATDSNNKQGGSSPQP